VTPLVVAEGTAPAHTVDLLADTRPTVDAISRLLDQARRAVPPRSAESHQGGPRAEEVDWLVQTRFVASLSEPGSLIKFEGFRQEWNACVARADDQFVAFRIGTPGTTLIDLPRPGPTFVVEVQWSPGEGMDAEVDVRLRPTVAPGADERDIVQELAGNVVHSLRQHLVGRGDRRAQDRVFWPHPVRVAFLLGEGQVGKPVPCVGKDLSLTGIGLYLPTGVPTHQVQLQLASPADTPPVTVNGTIVRIHRCSHRLFEVGVRFN
jgi:hypothetical protein